MGHAAVRLTSLFHTKEQDIKQRRDDGQTEGKAATQGGLTDLPLATKHTFGMERAGPRCRGRPSRGRAYETAISSLNIARKGALLNTRSQPPVARA